MEEAYSIMDQIFSTPNLYFVAGLTIMTTAWAAVNLVRSNVKKSDKRLKTHLDNFIDNSHLFERTEEKLYAKLVASNVLDGAPNPKLGTAVAKEMGVLEYRVDEIRDFMEGYIRKQRHGIDYVEEFPTDN